MVRMPISVQRGCRLMTSKTTNLGASTPLPEGGKSLRIPIERTSQRPLRALCAAAHQMLAERMRRDFPQSSTGIECQD